MTCIFFGKHKLLYLLIGYGVAAHGCLMKHRRWDSHGLFPSNSLFIKGSSRCCVRLVFPLILAGVLFLSVFTSPAFGRFGCYLVRCDSEHFHSLPPSFCFVGATLPLLEPYGNDRIVRAIFRPALAGPLNSLPSNLSGFSFDYFNSCRDLGGTSKIGDFSSLLGSRKLFSIKLCSVDP